MGTFESILQEAITGEHNAIRKYQRYAEIAQRENMPNIAYLFKAIMAGEKVHLENHKRALGTAFTPQDQAFETGTTLENLKAALATETWEYEEMYPGLIKQMKREKTERGEIARLSMQWALGTEKTHATTLHKAIDSVQQGKDYINMKLWVCVACGNLSSGDDLAGVCSVCKHDVRL
ncbi:MAG: rubrerythrin family protein, partial [Candidatus Sigynarchaeum springense]